MTGHGTPSSRASPKRSRSRARPASILTNTLFTAPAYKTYGGLIVDEKYDQVGFAAPLGLKDLRLTLAAAESHRAPMPLASLVRDYLLTVIAQGGEAQDWSALGRLAAHNAGL